MNIIVNGDTREVAAMTLAGVLEELGYRSSMIATAVNGRFIAKGDRPERVMTDGDRLEIVAPMQGG